MDLGLVQKQFWNQDVFGYENGFEYNVASSNV